MRFIRIATLCAFAAAASLAFAAPAAPDPGNGANVIHEIGCGVFVPGVGFFSITGHGVVTPSGNGNFTCHADTNASPPETIQFETGCFAPGGTGTGVVVLTKSGRLLFTCHVPR